MLPAQLYQGACFQKHSSNKFRSLCVSSLVGAERAAAAAAANGKYDINSILGAISGRCFGNCYFVYG